MMGNQEFENVELNEEDVLNANFEYFDASKG
jgi:hypothetical protein